MDSSPFKGTNKKAGIVEYIVEHAVGPVLNEKFDKMRPRLRTAQAERKAFFEKQKALEQRGIKPDLTSKVDRIGEEAVDELFDIKVLDPAMGSGHFLVEAVDFITDRMLTFLNAFPWNPVQAHLQRTRDTILAEVEVQGITLDPAKLTDVNLLKRHVLKRCIYGVDLNPMAVELAKVSLWLDCFTLGAPLSFLDHHLRCGNSLIGITEKQFEEAQTQQQYSLLEGSRYEGAKAAVGAMIKIGALPDITPEQTRASRDQYSIASQALAPFKRLFDVHASQWFGNEPRFVGKGRTRTEIRPAVDFLTDAVSKTWAEKPSEIQLSGLFAKVAQTALEASARNRFFHWELEFPEVFFGPRPGTTQLIERLEGAGFDAVIGNPPYVRVQELRQADPKVVDFLGTQYRSAVGNFDIYLPFFELGWQVTKGQVAYIAPNKWFATDYGEGLRRWVIERSALHRVVDFRDYQLFEDATNYTCIVALSRKPSEEYAYVDASRGEIARPEPRAAAELPRDGSSWTFSGGAEALLLAKLLQGVFPKLSGLRHRAFQGLRTSDNKVYVLQGAGKPSKGRMPVRSETTGEVHEIEAEVLKPMLSGEDIRAFSLCPHDQWMLFPYMLGAQGASLLSEKRLRADFPGAWRYLKACEPRLRKRERGRMDTSRWWAFGRTQNLDQFEQPKVMLPGYNNCPTAALDEDGRYYHVSGYSLTLVPDAPINLVTLEALLNSRLLFWALGKIGVALQRGFVEFRPQYLDRLPIAIPSNSDARKLQSLAERGAKEGYAGVAQELDNLVYCLYGLGAVEVALVEAAAQASREAA